MTSEEAIRRLNFFKNTVESDEDCEILDMAIKALEQKPTTKNDLGVDCISRKAVIFVLTVEQI